MSFRSLKVEVVTSPKFRTWESKFGKYNNWAWFSIIIVCLRSSFVVTALFKALAEPNWGMTVDFEISILGCDGRTRRLRWSWVLKRCIRYVRLFEDSHSQYWQQKFLYDRCFFWAWTLKLLSFANDFLHPRCLHMIWTCFGQVLLTLICIVL